MRLESKGAPDSPNRRVTQTRVLSHIARTPVGRPLWSRFERIGDDALDLAIRDRPRSTRPRLVVEPLESKLRESPTPAADCVAIDPQFFRNDLVLTAVRTPQDNACAHRERLRRLAAARIGLKGAPLLASQRDGRGGVLVSHRCMGSQRPDYVDPAATGFLLQGTSRVRAA